MSRLATALATASVLALLVAATPNGSVLSYNGDASIWAPNTAPSELTILPSQVRALNDAGYVWDDLRVPLASTSKPSITAPDWVEMMDSTGTGGSGGVWTWAFRATQEDDLLFTAQMPHGWQPGSEVEAHIHWTMTSTSVGPNDAGSLAAVWQLECAIGEINGSFKVSDTTSRREHAAYTARIYVGSGHRFEVGQNIVVSGLTEAGGCSSGAYNGNYQIIALDSATISYVTSVTCAEEAVDDTGGSVAGYTIVRTAYGTVTANSQWKHMMTDWGTYRMANCQTVSCIWQCRVSRPTSGTDIQESIPALEVDFHYMKGAIGSRQETTF